jgi:hypothetical protein
MGNRQLSMLLFIDRRSDSRIPKATTELPKDMSIAYAPLGAFP